MLLDLIHKIPNQMEEILGPEGRINFSLFRKAQNAFQVLASSPCYVVNFISAEEGTRTPTTLRSLAPEASASTNSATSAIYSEKLLLQFR